MYPNWNAEIFGGHHLPDADRQVRGADVAGYDRHAVQGFCGAARIAYGGPVVAPVPMLQRFPLAARALPGLAALIRKAPLS